jgi:hypothetical protein
MLQRCRRYLKKAVNEVRNRVLSPHTRWEIAQRRYEKWADGKLDIPYLNHVKRQGWHFAAFIGEPERMIDVGCGNGVFNGVSYFEAGYHPIVKGRGYVLGIDPLPLKQPIPWLSDFIQGKIEDMNLSGFNQAAFVTTFDHLEEPGRALLTLRRAGVKTIFLWQTLYKKHHGGDEDHPYHYTQEELHALMKSYGFRPTRETMFPGRGANEWFMEMKR